MGHMNIHILMIISALLLNNFSKLNAQTFCEPAEARVVEIRLKELQPLDGQTCTTVDAMVKFYSLVPERLLLPGIVIPANCTIQRLINYSCRERFGFCGSSIRTGSKYQTGSKYRTGTGDSDEDMAAKITIQVLILCNACNMVTGPTAIPTEGKISSDNFIDQQELATTFEILGLEFSVKAFETRDSRKGIKERTRGGPHTKDNGRKQMSNFNFFCENKLVSYGSGLVQCECPTECGF